MPDRLADHRREVDRFLRSVPADFNIAEVCADRWAQATPDHAALIAWRPDRPQAVTTFADLKNLSDRLAAGLAARGIGRGDRIAILLPQSVETVTAHLAAYKLGAIAVPLAALFGTQALSYRLNASGAAALITDAQGLARVAALADQGPGGEPGGKGGGRGGGYDGLILCTDGAFGTAQSYRRVLAEAQPDAFDRARTGPDDPAMMIFTSGTTGAPKGVLHGHRVLIGHLPGIAYSHEGFPQAGDRFWTPSDWAWAGGLLNALLPSLYHGVPVVFGPFGRFDPEAAMVLMAEAEVRNLFLPPTAINMLRGADLADLADAPAHRVRSLAAAGESLGRAAYAWSQSALGLTVNEFYGQTECNYVLGSAGHFGISRAGAIGKAIPGHRVDLVDDDGMPVPAGEQGQIAIAESDPGMFLEYWHDAEATRARFRNGRLLTGDLAVEDADGFVQFVGRNDDLIIASGYRIGPADIEDCLRAHPDVAQAVAVGKPDAVRNEIVKAYVVLAPEAQATPDLVDDLRQHVRARLSAAETPREIAFVDEIPMTTSGKLIRRHFRQQARREVDEA